MRRFQQVQFESALQSSIRVLPPLMMGASINILTVYLIFRAQVRTPVVTSALITTIASPIMATVQLYDYTGECLLGITAFSVSIQTVR